MFDLFMEGGPLFMLPLIIFALLVLIAAAGAVVRRLNGSGDEARWRHAVLHLGLLSLVFGALSQAVSLYQMMEAIQSVPSVSPAIVAGGLRVSFIAPLFGLSTFVVAMLVWVVLGLTARAGRLDHAATEPGM